MAYRPVSYGLLLRFEGSVVVVLVLRGRHHAEGAVQPGVAERAIAAAKQQHIRLSGQDVAAEVVGELAAGLAVVPTEVVNSVA